MEGRITVATHAGLVGGASEDHIGFQIFWGSLIGLMVPVMVFAGIGDYRKDENNSDRYDTFWGWLFQSVNGVACILIALFFLTTDTWPSA